jgi:hypothetical protein
MTRYIGISDCHGIESLVPDDGDTVRLLVLKAMANRHRYAVVYRVGLAKEQERTLRMLMEEGKNDIALRLLKAIGKQVEIEKGLRQSWEAIPNHALDPYWRKQDG